MLSLFRWLTLLAWLIWLVFYWGAGTGVLKDIAHAASSPLDRLCMRMSAFGALGLFSSMVVTLLGIVSLPQREVLAVIGAMLALAGVTASFYCRHRLGRFWTAATALQEHHEIIDKGPYGVVRHPIYTATLGFYLGTALAFVAWWNWVLFAVLVVAYALKAVDEERFLQANLSAAHEDYRRRVPYRLLPGVW